MTAATDASTVPLPTPGQYVRPVPLVDGLAAPFWEGARAHVLRYQRCTTCAHAHLPAARRCANCGSDALGWADAAGTGEVFTFTVMHKAYHPGFADRLPYVVAIVQLTEGPVLLSSIEGCAPDAVRIGMPVSVTFDDITTEHTLPRFRPAGLVDAAGQAEQ